MLFLTVNPDKFNGCNPDTFNGIYYALRNGSTDFYAEFDVEVFKIANMCFMRVFTHKDKKANIEPVDVILPEKYRPTNSYLVTSSNDVTITEDGIVDPPFGENNMGKFFSVVYSN